MVTPIARAASALRRAAGGGLDVGGGHAMQLRIVGQLRHQPVQAADARGLLVQREQRRAGAAGDRGAQIADHAGGLIAAARDRHAARDIFGAGLADQEAAPAAVQKAGQLVAERQVVDGGKQHGMGIGLKGHLSVLSGLRTDRMGQDSPRRSAWRKGAPGSRPAPGCSAGRG
ncbi:hypothetical protein [Paracoccus sp. (in: a-proteobacteria)]|uniref:hypothetical protein n=1 Tax=Paracoccus sp. TaxID=267 RepID=UPI0032202E8A